MTEQELFVLIAEAIEGDVSELGLEVDVAAVAGWDSVGWLSVMAVLDERLGVSLSSSDIAGITTVGDLVKLLRTRGAVSNG